MLSTCRHGSLSGTNVVRDFVELPSQLMENWLDEREWLQSFAVHYQTGQALPEVLIERMERARHFLAGYAACRQLSFGYLDMAWHTITEPLAEALIRRPSKMRHGRRPSSCPLRLHLAR